MFRRSPTLPLLLVSVLSLPSGVVAQDEEPMAPPEKKLRWSIESKFHYRDSEQLAIKVPFLFPETFLPVGQDDGFVETVDEGSSFEISTVTLVLDARPSDSITAHAKIDFIDLYDRNPTSGDKDIDVDEAWIRFGRETDPGFVPEGFGAYVKLGKMGRFERQDDRHLESYGLVSTAFNRFEDLGLEAGFDLGSRVYVKVAATAGNPLFFRDPNALAGDNGIDEQLRDFPDPELKSGISILYDAEVEDLDVDGDLEISAGVGVRIGPALGPWNLEVLAFGSERDLADTVDLEGTFYGGDLDILLGPFNEFPYPISGRSKEELGANVWFYSGGFSAFAQWVDQEVAGLGRTGWEAELAWGFDLPLVAAVGGKQLFPYVQPAVRFSRLEPDFEAPAETPSPSWAWPWDKWDVGLRLGLMEGADLTVEYAKNEFILKSGAEVGHDELLTTLRWKF